MNSPQGETLVFYIALSSCDNVRTRLVVQVQICSTDHLCHAMWVGERVSVRRSRPT